MYVVMSLSPDGGLVQSLSSSAVQREGGREREGEREREREGLRERERERESEGGIERETEKERGRCSYFSCDHSITCIM